MEYEIKPNKGSVFPIDDRSGDMILSGKLNIESFTKKDDGYVNKAVVVKEPNGNLAVYVQAGIMFAEAEDSGKDYAYSGPLGEGKKVFAYRNETGDGKQYLGLSVAEQDPSYAAAPAPVQAAPVADVVSLPNGEQVAKNDIPF